MSSFSCNCGAVVRDDVATASSIVAYPQPVLTSIESRIAKSIADFLATGDVSARADWIVGYFDTAYPANQPDEMIIEDIVTRELNDGFESMFRCPSCDRLWVFDRTSDQWISYRVERGQADQ